MDLVNKSFCAQFLSQFPSIKWETISILCLNGFEDYYHLIGLNIDSDLPFISEISLGQKALIRKALILLNSNYDNQYDPNDSNQELNPHMNQFIINNQIIDNHNQIKANNETNDKKIAFICLDSHTDEDTDYEDFNRLRDYQFINQKENNCLDIQKNIKQEISVSDNDFNQCLLSQEMDIKSNNLFDKQNRDSNELKIKLKNNVKKMSERRKSKELIPLSLIKSRQMPDCDYYKLLKTVRMPYILINRMNISEEVLRNKLLFNENQFNNRLRLKPKNSRAESKSKFKGYLYKTKGQFRCEFPDCGYSGPNAHYLRMHKYRHTGEKHITCQWPGCQFSSIWRHSVREHYYTHTNEKPHKCGWNGCQYSSAQSGNLAKHRRIHQKEKQHFDVDHTFDKIIDKTEVNVKNQNNGFVINSENRINKRIEINIDYFMNEELEEQTNIDSTVENTLSPSRNAILVEENHFSIEGNHENYGNQVYNNFKINNKFEEKIKVVKKRGRPPAVSQIELNSDLQTTDLITEIIDNKRVELSDNLEHPQLENNYSYKCLWPDCVYQSDDSNQFQNHCETHSPIKRKKSVEKPEVKCCWPGCEYKTKWIRLLSDHQNAHKGIRPHKCNYCDYDSSYFGDIRRHMSKKHSLILNELKKSRKSKQNEMKLKPKMNEIKIKKIESLKPITETIEEVIKQSEQLDDCQPSQPTHEFAPFICETSQENTGNELKPYFCGWSGCAFSTFDSDMFVSHRREHTGVLQYHCDQPQCYYETARFNSLIIHKRRYHRIETSLETSFDTSLLTTNDNNSQEGVTELTEFNIDFDWKDNYQHWVSDEYFANLTHFSEHNFF